MAVDSCAPVNRDRAELAEALTHLVFTARRRFRKVGTLELPTPWDRDHAQIDELLTLLELSE